MGAARDIYRLLTFRSSNSELHTLGIDHLKLGLLGTWLVGMGRYWDDPEAKLLQHLGVGSLVYIFVMAALIWIVIKPYRIKPWRYVEVLTFVSLTSFPAVFYAIPVERLFALPVAASINAWFLAIVAAWRLGLLLFFLRRYSGLRTWYLVVGALLPVCFIVAALTALNLERAVFNIMGGLRHATSQDQAYQVLLSITLTATLLVVPLTIGYIVAIVQRRRRTD